MGKSPTLQINSRAVLRGKKGHPWVFRSDILKIEAKEAGVVTVLSPKGKPLGTGLYSPSSQITLRWLTWGPEPFKREFIQDRMLRSLQLRKKSLKEPQVGRMVFGESDGLPSLLVDRIEGLISFQTLSAGMETLKPDIISFIKEIYSPHTILEKNDAAIRSKENLPQICQIVYGEDPVQREFQIEGKKYCFDFLKSQKTGFFLDQRFNAVQVAPFLGGRLLDAFCYSGQFTFQSAGLWETALCLDQSEEILLSLKNNAKLNHIENISTQCSNAFDALREFHREGRQFESIVLDPPAFVKGRAGLEGALRGYKEINLRALKLLSPGGHLATFSCSQNLPRSQFLEILRNSAQDAHRSVQILLELTQPPDHPRLLSMPESDYLKGFLMKVS